MSDDGGNLPAEVPGGDDVALLAAALRADVGDLETYERVLVATLADSLPMGCVEVDRDRSLSDRLANRPGTIRAIRVTLGQQTLESSPSNGRTSSAPWPGAWHLGAQRRRHPLRKEVPLDEWSAALALALSEFARESAAARAALERLLGTS